MEALFWNLGLPLIVVLSVLPYVLICWLIISVIRYLNRH